MGEKWLHWTNVGVCGSPGESSLGTVEWFLFLFTSIFPELFSSEQAGAEVIGLARCFALWPVGAPSQEGPLISLWWEQGQCVIWMNLARLIQPLHVQYFLLSNAKSQLQLIAYLTSLSQVSSTALYATFLLILCHCTLSICKHIIWSTHVYIMWVPGNHEVLVFWIWLN